MPVLKKILKLPVKVEVTEKGSVKKITNNAGRELSKGELARMRGVKVKSLTAEIEAAPTAPTKKRSTKKGSTKKAAPKRSTKKGSTKKAAPKRSTKKGSTKKAPRKTAAKRSPKKTPPNRR